MISNYTGVPCHNHHSHVIQPVLYAEILQSIQSYQTIFICRYLHYCRVNKTPSEQNHTEIFFNHFSRAAVQAQHIYPCQHPVILMHQHPRTFTAADLVLFRRILVWPSLLICFYCFCSALKHSLSNWRVSRLVQTNEFDWPISVTRGERHCSCTIMHGQHATVKIENVRQNLTNHHII